MLYEYLLDGRVDTVEVSAGGSIEQPTASWPIAAFHVDCYRTLVAALGQDEGIRYVGTCPISTRSISSPRPLSHCPMCASPMQFAQTQAPTRQATP